ncbi:MAG: hypothetical protein M1818_001283 [Claussenomyces sp. TS43310]|nr:MAG: hypothetical protein M1818_001283 [Claussenomyces sp. TS43310]
MDTLIRRGGPYASRVAAVGGLPNRTVDVPITSVFLVLFIIGAASHMTILQLNLRRSHKFLASGGMFGFCFSRVITCTLRLAWATHPTNISLAIAATIFVNAGVIVIIIINLIFAQRILRASHPKIGWHRSIHYGFLAYLASIIILLVMLITSIVQQSYTLSTNTRRIDHDLALTGSIYFTVAAFLPLPVVTLSILTRHVGRLATLKEPTEKFGTGRFRTKLVIILIASALICLGASFRCATSWLVRPRSHPAWYNSKACFYCFNFTIEIIVIYTYALIRIDRRFYIPNGARGAGSYAANTKGTDLTKKASNMRVETEDEFMEDFALPESREQDLEAAGEKRQNAVDAGVVPIAARTAADG